MRKEDGERCGLCLGMLGLLNHISFQAWLLMFI